MFRRKPWRPSPLKLPATDSGSAEWPSLDSPTFSHASDEDDRRHREEPIAKLQQQGTSRSQLQQDDHAAPVVEKPPLSQQRARTTPPVLPKLKLGKVSNREPLQQLELPVNRRPEALATSTEHWNEPKVPPLAVPALVLEDTSNGASSSSDALKGTTNLSARRRPPPSYSSTSSTSRQGSPRSSRKEKMEHKAPGPVPELSVKEDEHEEPQRPHSARSKATPRGSMPRLSLGRLLTPRGRRDIDPEAAALESRRPSTARAPSSGFARHHHHHQQQQQQEEKEEHMELQVSRTPRGGGVPGLGSLIRLLTPRGGSKRKHPLPWGHKGSSSSSSGRTGAAAAAAAAAGGGGQVPSSSSSPSEAVSSALEAMQSPDGPEQLRGTEALAELVQDPGGCEAASSKGAVGILAGLLCAAEAEAKAAHRLLLLRNKAPPAADSADSADSADAAACDVAALHPAAVPALEALVLLLPGSVENRGALRSYRGITSSSRSSSEGGGGSSSGGSEGGGEALRCLVRLLGASGGSAGQEGGQFPSSSPWQPPPRARFLALLAVRVMTEHEGDRQAVHDAGGVPALLGLLGDEASPQGIRENAAGALGNLAAGARNVKAALRCAGAVPVLVGLLGAPPPGAEGEEQGGGAEGDVLAEFACGALMNMSLRNLPNRQAILEAGGLDPLLRHLSAGQEVLRESWDCRVQMIDGAVHPATVSFDLSQGHMLVTPRPRGRPQRVRSLFTPRAPRGLPSSASSPGSSSSPGAATHVYSMLSKFKMVEPHPGALEMRFESDAASTGGRHPYRGLAPLRTHHHHQGSSSPSSYYYYSSSSPPSGSSLTLSCVVLQPCPADDVRSAVLKMMTRVHMEREFRSSESPSAPVPSSFSSSAAAAAGAPSAEPKAEHKGAEEAAELAAEKETEKAAEAAAVAPSASLMSTKSSSVLEELPHQERMRPLVELQRNPDAAPSSSSSCTHHSASTSSASRCSPGDPNQRHQEEEKRILAKGKAAEPIRQRYPASSAPSSPSSVSVTSSASTATSGAPTAALPCSLSLRRSQSRSGAPLVSHSLTGAPEAEQDDSAGVFFGGGLFAYRSAAAGSCNLPGAAADDGDDDDGVLVGSPEASPPRSVMNSAKAVSTMLPTPPSPCHLPIPAIALDGLLHANAAAAAESVASGSAGGINAGAPPPLKATDSNGTSAVGRGRRSSSARGSGGVTRPAPLVGTRDCDDQVTPELQFPALGSRGQSDDADAAEEEEAAARAAATECFKSIAAAAAVLSTDGGRSVRAQRYSSLRRRQSLIPSYSDKGARYYARSQSAPRSRVRPSSAVAAATTGPASPTIDIRSLQQQQGPAMMGFDAASSDEGSPVLNLPAQTSTFLLSGSNGGTDGHDSDEAFSSISVVAHRRRLSLPSHLVQPTPYPTGVSGRPGMTLTRSDATQDDDDSSLGSPARPSRTTPPTLLPRLDFDCLLRLDEQEAPETPGSWLKQPRTRVVPS